jgi:hypothetical protein
MSQSTAASPTSHGIGRAVAKSGTATKSGQPLSCEVKSGFSKTPSVEVRQ